MSMRHAVNPFFHAATQAGAAALTAVPRRGAARYARLPEAPVTASPVPRLTSLYHNPDPGPYGSRGYPGNCSGNLIKDLLVFYGARNCLDPMAGSGTCADVCKELGIYCMSSDLKGGKDACDPGWYPRGCFDFCWLHPPYHRQKPYSDDPRCLSRCPSLAGFLERYEALIRNCAGALVPGGRLAVLMGDYCDKDEGFLPLVFHTKQIAFRLGLRQVATDIIRFSHGASSGRKVYRTSFIPGLHDVACVFQAPVLGEERA
jgi:hypothetical protein